MRDFLWYGFVTLVVGKTRRFIGETPYRWIVGVLGAALVYFGGSFIVGALEGLHVLGA